jgi:hypothetical protein
MYSINSGGIIETSHVYKAIVKKNKLILPSVILCVAILMYIERGFTIKEQ